LLTFFFLLLLLLRAVLIGETEFEPENRNIENLFAADGGVAFSRRLLVDNLYIVFFFFTFNSMA
jgi:hypothetical protein